MLALTPPTPLDPDRCWEAVRRRDPSVAGPFLVAVKTTGIFCRPGCPSRAPRRENVLFFASADDAKAAGFRACLRCRPEEPHGDDPHRGAVEAACRTLAASEAAPSTEALARAAGLSRHHFHRVFTRIVGATPGAYARTLKLRRLSDALDGGTPVTAAIYDAGYGSSSRAYAAAPSGLGMTPGARRRGGAGETIRYTFVPTTLGEALLAASPRGLCRLAFGDSRDEMVKGLCKTFPAATLVEDAVELADWAVALSRHLAAPGGALDLPLDVRGTAFQARVWAALRAIPPGTTASYKEIAARLDQPNAVRAVARACASNDLAVLIPCHRVIGANGDLTGYRWGVERKRALIESERRAAERAPVAAEAPGRSR